MTVYLLILIFGSSVTASGASFYDRAPCVDAGKAWVQTSPGPADFVCLPVKTQLLP